MREEEREKENRKSKGMKKKRKDEEEEEEEQGMTQSRMRQSLVWLGDGDKATPERQSAVVFRPQHGDMFKAPAKRDWGPSPPGVLVHGTLPHSAIPEVGCHAGWVSHGADCSCTVKLSFNY